MKKIGPSQRAFEVFNVLFMLLLVFVTLYPFYYVIVASFTSSSVLQSYAGVLWWPIRFTTKAYEMTFTHPLLLSGFRNTLFIMAVAMPINFLFTIVTAYFMYSRGMLFKKPLMLLMLVTMFFNGGLIPTYLNIRSLGLYDSLWALILPASLSLYNAIITKTALEGIPDSLIESAYIDGASDPVILFRILTPLIVPTLAVIMLYYGVGHWNSWFYATIYLNSNEKLPIQAVLRAILIANEKMLDTATPVEGVDYVDSYAETIKYAVIIVSTVPILCIYPFLQKYFVNGVMIGAVKG